MSCPWVAVIDDTLPSRGIRDVRLPIPGYHPARCFSTAEAITAVHRLQPVLVIVDLDQDHPAAGLEVVAALQGKTYDPFRLAGHGLAETQQRQGVRGVSQYGNLLLA